MAQGRLYRDDEEDWGREEEVPARPSTPPAPTLAPELPRARITSVDVSNLYPSVRSLSSSELPGQHHAAPTPCTAETTIRAAASHAAPACRIWSLQALCLGIVGQYLEQYVEQLGPHALAWLPPDMKAALVAVARRRRILTDQVLLALHDVACTSLDLWGSGHQLSDQAIRKTVCAMPHLQALDITGCINISARTLRKIAAHCPELKLLRLGVAQVEQAAAEAMPDILPRIQPVADEDVEDSWEMLADAGAGSGAGDRAGAGLGSQAMAGVEQGAGMCSGPGDDANVWRATGHLQPREKHNGSSSGSSEEGCRECDRQSGGESYQPCASCPISTDRTGAGRVTGNSCGRRSSCDKAAGAASRAGDGAQAEPGPGNASGSGAAASAAAAAAFGQGRLVSLRWLIWPNVSKDIKLMVQQQCPKVQLNPMPAALSKAVARASTAAAGQQQRRAQQQQQQQQSQPPALHAAQKPGRSPCHSFGTDPASGPGSEELGVWDPLDPMCALDQPLVSLAGPAAWEGLHSGCATATPQAAPCKSLAERFRQAYIDRAARLRFHEQRIAEALRKRQLRSDKALQALTSWLDEA